MEDKITARQNLFGERLVVHFQKMAPTGTDCGRISFSGHESFVA
jgi:hypothetical protein